MKQRTKKENNNGWIERNKRWTSYDREAVQGLRATGEEGAIVKTALNKEIYWLTHKESKC